MRATLDFRPDYFGLPSDYRPRQYAQIWKTQPPDWRERLAAAVNEQSGNHSPTVFFRADDVGAGGKAFNALCRLFRFHKIPLALAVVPAWLSTPRISQLFQEAPLDETLWSWHQHGWRHVNWQRSGKKSEFGKQRPFEKQWKDIWQGRQKMEDIFGSHFIPVFTPPWNRLTVTTLKILHELDFMGVSLAEPLPRGHRANSDLVNLRIQLDLHTRKSRNGFEDFEKFLAELRFHLGRKEPLGIMLHHQRMTLFAFEFLHALIEQLKNQAHAKFLSFEKLAKKSR